MVKRLLCICAAILSICFSAGGSEEMGNYQLSYTGAQVDAALSNMAALESGDIAEYLENNNSLNLGSPKGVYADLAALTAANPDHSKIYITLDDGNWYYWSGSAWTAGGVYQSTGIAENSISPTKLQGALATGNLLPYAVKTVVGKYASDSNDDNVLDETESATFTYHIIKVTPGKQYTCTNGRIVVLLAANQSSVIEVLTYQDTFNAGVAEYVAVSYNHNDHPTATYTICEGDRLVAEEYVRVPWLQLANPGSLSDGIVTWPKIDGAEPVGNLLPHALRSVVGKYAADDGGVLSEQASASFTYHIFKVAPNTNYSCTFARFVVVLADDMLSTVQYLQNVASFDSGSGKYVALSYNHVTYPTETWELRKTGDTIEGSKIQIPWLLTGADESGASSASSSLALHSTRASMASGDSMIIGTSYDIKKRKTISFYGRMGGAGSVSIGQGLTHYSGSYATVDSVHITVYEYTSSAVQVAQAAHGLAINDFMSITIAVKTGLADVILSTSTGDFTLSEAPFSGAGPIEVKINSGSFTECVGTWACADLAQDVWIFGDSYIGLTSPERWPYHLISKGFEDWLACGYPGAGSGSQYACFQNLSMMGRPKSVAWLLGMNDGDAGSINPTWLASVQGLLAYCEVYGIEPILATIPSTPVVDNSFKNAWVRASGKRFIDFEKAVGADISTAWYAGMLDGDQVHPLEPGAKALAARVMVDLPEVCR